LGTKREREREREAERGLALFCRVEEGEFGYGEQNHLSHRKNSRNEAEFEMGW